MTYDENFETNVEFEKNLKSWRGKGWIFYRGYVAGKLIELKTFNHTYCQILRVNGANKRLPCMDCKVSEFNAAIKESLV